MRYLEIEIEHESERGRELPSPVVRALALLLRAVVPTGNDDVITYWDDVAVWWLEVEDSGLPNREIGFDREGRAIVLAPVGNNIGFLIDASDDWSGWEPESPEAAAFFESVWRDLWPRFERFEREP